MNRTLGRKILTSIALVAIIAQSFSPYVAVLPQKAYAQDATPTVDQTTPNPITPTVTETPSSDQTITPTPTDTITPTPTDTPTPEVTSELTPTPTVDNTATATPTPTDNLSPPSDNSNNQPQVQGDSISVTPTPTLNATPSATPTPTETSTGNEKISMIILKDVAAPTINLDTIVEGSASLTTDKADYAPTDTALITGSNLIPNTEYTLVISSSNNPVVNFSTNVTSDDKGTFAYAYQLDGKYRPNYKAELKDSDGKVVATTSFTDTPTPVTTTILVKSLQPDWTTGVWAAYYAPDSDTGPAVSPGSTAVYDGAQAGIIKAGITPENGHYKDEGLLAFKVPSVSLSSFASQTLTYVVENQTGSSPVWVRIRLTDVAQTEYQYVPASYGTANGYHEIDAAGGLWQLMDSSGNAVGSKLTLAQVAANNSGLLVDRVYLTLGQGDSYNVSSGVGTVAWVDKATIGNTIYDFVVAPGVPSCDLSNTFDSFNLGSVNGQSGWSSTGLYDQAIVSNSYGFSSFGCKSLRLSNAITSGSFGDQTFSPAVANPAGESTSYNHFEASFDIGSTQSVVQPGLFLSVSPDDGNGSRMSYVGFQDENDGIHVIFYDVTDPGPKPAVASFNERDVATIDRNQAHSIKLSIDFVSGPANDVVKLYVDNILKATGTTWEDYYRYDPEQAGSGNIVPTTSKLLFREGGTAVPATNGQGYLIDNVSLSSTNILPDTTPPDVPTLISPADGTYRHTLNLNKSDWKNVTDPSSPVVYYYESSLSKDANSDGSFKNTAYKSDALTVFEIMNPGEPEVTYYWHVKACDAVGNCSAWSPAWQINIDNTNPTVPSLTSPSNNGFETTNDFYFTWTNSNDISPVTYEFQSSGSSNVDGNGSLTNAWDSITNGNSEQNHLTSPQIHSTGAPDGTYYWQVRAIDAAGNKSTWSNAWRMTIDTVAPAVPTGIYFKDTVNSKDVACGGATSAKNFDVYWKANTEPDFDHYEYISFNADGSAGPIRTFTTPYFNASWWTVPAEGTYGVQIRAVDKAGNKSAWFGGSEGINNSCTYTVDWTAPTVKLVFPTPGPSATSFQAVFSEDVNSTEATTPANYFLNNWPGAGGSGNLDGHATVSYDSTTHIATVTFKTPGWYISPEQQWGVQNIQDLAGNTQQSNPHAEYSTSMVKPVTTDSGTDSNWHNAPVTVILSCTDINGSGCKDTYYTTDGSTPTTSSTSGNSITLNIDGIYTIKYFSMDNAGNVEDIKTASNTVYVDQTPPTLPTATPVADDYTTDQLVTLNSTDSGSGLAGIFYTIGGSKPDNNSTPYTAPITVDKDMTINAIAYDNAGNASDILEANYGITIPSLKFSLNMLSNQGGPGDGLSDGLSSCPSCTQTPQNNAQVLGASTGPAVLGLAFAPGVLGAETTQPEVLGAATSSAQPTPSVNPTVNPTTSTLLGKNLVSSSTNWVLNHIMLSLLILLVLAGLGYYLYRKRKKKQNS